MDRYARIVSTGSYLPEIEVPNAQLKQHLESVSPGLGGVIDKFEQATGIVRRYYAPREWATSDLAVRAAQVALQRAGVRPEQVDMILLGTDSPDYITPATSVVVQHKLGAKNAGTYDIGCACASFPTAMASAAGLIATNPWMKNVLVIGAYMMSKLGNPNDPTTFYYGDGAGAALLTAGSKPGFITSSFKADGYYHKHWGIYAGGTYEPTTAETVAAGRNQVQFIERFPAEVNHEGWPHVTRMLAEHGGFGLNDIDMAIFTQVRLKSIHVVMEALGLPIEKAHWIMDSMGYTGSACIPMALDDAISKGKINPGNLVVLVGSGVGYNQAGVAFRMA